MLCPYAQVGDTLAYIPSPILYIIYTHLNFINIWTVIKLLFLTAFYLYFMNAVNHSSHTKSYLELSLTGKVNWTYVYELWDVAFSQPILELHLQAN